MTKSGQILPIVMASLLLLLMMIAALVNWIQKDTNWTVKNQKTTAAVNFAEAGLDRGVWILQSSTFTWTRAAAGTVLAGYNFDTTYTDIPGGKYRIKITSGPAAYQVTVLSEGRDLQAKETRAVQLVVQNQTIPGPILTGGTLADNGVFEVHWGPLLAQGNITLSGTAATRRYPRKYSKGVVVGTAGNPRDINGLSPPNTDNTEWWSSYPVTNLPQLDFTTMRSSAQANGTLNFYTGTASSETLNFGAIVWPGSAVATETANAHGRCEDPVTNNPFGVHTNHFYDCHHHPRSKSNLIWYWDGDLVLTGDQNWAGGYVSGDPKDPCHRMGMRGTLIVRGNLTIYAGDCYQFTGAIPPQAWREYQAIDTSANDQYPGDAGMQAVDATFIFGNETWTGGPIIGNTDVGIRGFIYVGGNMTIQDGAQSDFSGAFWVVGNTTNLNATEAGIIFYDNSLQIPTLNVVLARQSWKEISPSTVVWP